MKIVIIDSFALIHRVYHALPGFTTPLGEPSGAVYGFCSVILKVIKKFNPDRIIAAFDEGTTPTFRKELASSYHANRPPKDPLMLAQVETIKEFLGHMGIRAYTAPGFEGDDVIGTLAHQLSGRGGVEVVIVTGDYDTLQLVNEQTTVFTMRKGITDTVLFDEAAVREKYGFPPEYLADYKALMGDPSDNYPGVSGIGPKTAQQLVQHFKTVENLYEFLEGNSASSEKPDLLSKTLLEKLKNGKEQAFLSKTLARIRTDVPISVDQVFEGGPAEVTPGVREFFERMNFNSLLQRLDAPDHAPASPRQRKKRLPPPNPLRLFG